MVDKFPWEKDFYDPALFEAGAGDKDEDVTVWTYLKELDSTPLRVLDIGCGTGRFAMRCANLGHQVMGIDNSSAMLKEFKKQRDHVSIETRRRLGCRYGAFESLVPPHNRRFHIAVAMDDFTTHYLDASSLNEFFRSVQIWTTDDGVFLTDLRVRDAARLAAAAMPGPKPIQTFGIVECKLDSKEAIFVAMRFWEEYHSEEKILVCHQIYDFLNRSGIPYRTVYKTIRQRIHSPEDILAAARMNGFRIGAFRTTTHSTIASSATHVFWRFEKSGNMI